MRRRAVKPAKWSKEMKWLFSDKDMTQIRPETAPFATGLDIGVIDRWDGLFLDLSHRRGGIAFISAAHKAINLQRPSDDPVVAEAFLKLHQLGFYNNYDVIAHRTNKFIGKLKDLVKRIKVVSTNDGPRRFTYRQIDVERRVWYHATRLSHWPSIKRTGPPSIRGFARFER